MADASSFRCARPAGPLSRFVDYFWTYDGYTPQHRRERLLPTGAMELVFRLDADGRATSGVAGPHSSAAILDTSQPFSVIAVHFKCGGGFPFFAVPSCEIHNQSVELDALWGRGAVRVRDQLWEAATARERFVILQRALLDSARGFDRDAAVQFAIGEFERSNGSSRVADVVSRVGVSSNRLLARFRTEVGFSPKAFCRIHRFNSVLREIDGHDHVNWTDVALSCGYFDQAHFNHDFRDFAGLSPSEYLRDRVARLHVAVRDSA